MEIRVIEYTRRLKKKRDVDGGQQVKDLELVQSKIWKTANGENLQAAIQAEADEKKENLLKRSQHVRVRIGKKPMFRSNKLNKKKKKVVKEMDTDKLAFLRYLGQLDEIEEVVAKPSQQ